MIKYFRDECFYLETLRLPNEFIEVTDIQNEPDIKTMNCTYRYASTKLGCVTLVYTTNVIYLSCSLISVYVFVYMFGGSEMARKPEREIEGKKVEKSSSMK